MQQDKKPSKLAAVKSAISSKLSGLWKLVSKSPSEKSSEIDALTPDYSLAGLFGIEQVKLLWKKPTPQMELEPGTEFGALLRVQSESSLLNVMIKFVVRGDTVTFLKQTDTSAILSDESSEDPQHFVNPFNTIASGLYGINSMRVALFALNEDLKFELQNSKDFPEPIDVLQVKHTSTKILVRSLEFLYVIDLPILSIEKKPLPGLGLELVLTEKRAYLFDGCSLLSIDDGRVKVQIGNSNIIQSTN